MALEQESDKKTQYETYEQYREKFYGVKEKPKAKGDQQEDDETASFGKRLAREFGRRK